MTDPMQQAVEVLARAICPSDYWHLMRDASKDDYRNQARAPLAEIAPPLIAAETEACAKLADAQVYARLLEHQLAPANSEAHEFALHRAREAKALAAAIRERGTK